MATHRNLSVAVDRSRSKGMTRKYAFVNDPVKSQAQSKMETAVWNTLYS